MVKPSPGDSRAHGDDTASGATQQGGPVANQSGHEHGSSLSAPAMSITFNPPHRVRHGKLDTWLHAPGDSYYLTANSQPPPS